ncbi:hypothetical protein PAPYR_10785 [Paratrimastix pyriformis]|uniref:Uncharacterized protein n=1 Tax=Paratrimastix pyriformis TaxID=342808 RepID=A0ABQ8U704_9EUKA|nr:hypothetical protein PAPYR_10785 [Paratrimastix pyriformis]
MLVGDVVQTLKRIFDQDHVFVQCWWVGALQVLAAVVFLDVFQTLEGGFDQYHAGVLMVGQNFGVVVLESPTHVPRCLLALFHTTLGRGPLPAEVLLCHGKTSADELMLFLSRWLHGAMSAAFPSAMCLANAHQLDPALQTLLIQELRKAHHHIAALRAALAAPGPVPPPLFIVLAGGTQERLASELQRWVISFAAPDAAQVLGLVDDIIRKDCAALQVVESSLPGQGKTHVILQTVQMLTAGNPGLAYRRVLIDELTDADVGGRCEHWPIFSIKFWVLLCWRQVSTKIAVGCLTHNSRDQNAVRHSLSCLDNRFQRVLISSFRQPSSGIAPLAHVAYHLDIGPTVSPAALDTLLFSWLVVGVLVSTTGEVLHRRREDGCFVELATVLQGRSLLAQLPTLGMLGSFEPPHALSFQRFPVACTPLADWCTVRCEDNDSLRLVLGYLTAFDSGLFATITKGAHFSIPTNMPWTCIPGVQLKTPRSLKFFKINVIFLHPPAHRTPRSLKFFKINVIFLHPPAHRTPRSLKFFKINDTPVFDPLTAGPTDPERALGLVEMALKRCYAAWQQPCESLTMLEIASFVQFLVDPLTNLDRCDLLSNVAIGDPHTGLQRLKQFLLDFIIKTAFHFVAPSVMRPEEAARRMQVSHCDPGRHQLSSPAPTSARQHTPRRPCSCPFPCPPNGPTPLCGSPEHCWPARGGGGGTWGLSGGGR